MANYFIYGGLITILVALIFALIAAIIGWKAQGWKIMNRSIYRRLIDPNYKMPKAMKPYLVIAAITFVVGAIILGIGFEKALN